MNYKENPIIIKQMQSRMAYNLFGYSSALIIGYISYKLIDKSLSPPKGYLWDKVLKVITFRTESYLTDVKDGDSMLWEIYMHRYIDSSLSPIIEDGSKDFYDTKSGKVWADVSHLNQYCYSDQAGINMNIRLERPKNQSFSDKVICLIYGRSTVEYNFTGDEPIRKAKISSIPLGAKVTVCEVINDVGPRNDSFKYATLSEAITE